MAALKLTACMKVVAKMGETDQEALLERLDRYTADGVPKDRAQVMAAADTMAELQDERREFMAMLRQQHPDLFVVTNAIPEDQDVDPDAPDIKRSAAREITDTPEFKRWFGDSKVVDEDGSPLVVYHGARTDFSVFDTDPWKSFGAHFGPIEQAGQFASDSGGRVMPVYLSIQKPLRIVDMGAWGPDQLAEELNKMGVISDYWAEEIPRRLDDPDDDFDALAVLRGEIRKAGYDGIVYLNRGEGFDAVGLEDFIASDPSDSEFRAAVPDAKDSYIIFRPEQVKSAIGNNGQFDPKNADITRSPARQIETPEFKAWSEGLPVHDSFEDRSSDRGIYKLFHMTTADFSEFKPGGLKPTDSGPAIWLSADPAATSAAFRVGNAERGFRTGARTMPVYAKVKNPLVIDDAGMLDYARNSFADGSREFPQLISKRTADALKEDGYDSIIFDGPGVGWKGASAEVIVLDGKQIKSAIGNSGAFDPATADITRSRKRQPSEVFGREIAPAAIRAYKSLSAGAKSIVDGWNVNWSMGQGRLRNSRDFDEVVKAYEPVREKLRQIYGGTVPAFRGEKQDGTESTDDRFLFSWTPMRDIAAGFAVNRRYGMPAEIPQSKVDEQIEAYRKTGIARLNGYKFVRKDPGDYEPDGPDYYHIYQRGMMLTDGDDIAQALQQEKDERDEWISELRDSGKLYAGNIPVDSVAFIPVGANLRQPEFVAEYNPRKDAVGEIRLSAKRNELGFHSALERGIEGMQTKSAPAGAWKTQIKGLVNKGSVKQDEVTWSGIEDWLDLQEGKVTKEAIAEYLQQGGVQVEETTLGVADYFKNAGEAIAYLADRYSMTPDEVREEYGYTDERDYIELARSIVDDRGDQSKYGKYTLPGGENYREVLLMLPTRVDAETQRLMKEERYLVLGPEEQARVDAAKKKAGVTYRSSHWDQPNVLAHIRVNDRTDADGKRVLFVEELQSDWGQDGKKKGVVKSYRPDDVQPISAVEAGKMTSADEELFWHFKTPDNVFSIPKSKYADRDAAREYIIREKKINSGGVPDAPFIGKTEGWLNLALKRIVTMAVDGGYDKVAFVNGEQSADRYDLSKQVEELMIEKDGDNFTIAMKPVGGYYGDGGRWSGKAQELPDVVGKELADKVAAQPEGRSYMKGLDLKVGGEGMKVFYDKIVPNAVKALLKKVDSGKVEVVAIPDANAGREVVAAQVPGETMWGVYDRQKGQWLESWDNETYTSDPENAELTSEKTAKNIASAIMRDAGVMLEQPGFTITDAMREKVATEGLPLFSRKRDVTDTPEFQAWFGGSKVVDADGKPLVVYHGTTADFSVFDTTKGKPGWAEGAWFSSENPSRYANGDGARVMPVYLSIKNPKVMDFANRGYDKAQLETEGYDGVIDIGRSGQPYTAVAFRPEQIKSAIGNNGQFDPANPDIRRSTGRTSTGAAWDSPSASKFDDLVYKFQDKLVDTKRIVEAIKDASGAIADDLNVYLQEELYHGRAAKRTEDFVNMELNPLVQQMADDGLKMEDLEEYLHARHAPEANDVIAKRNPGVAELQDGGSGMKTADALNYMTTLPADLRQKLERAAAMVDDIISSTRQLYVDYELESQDTVDAWGKMFQHYIPLQREDKEGTGSPGIGQGFSVKGKETKGRTGSTRKVVDILANIAMQREKAIVRGEKNRVSQALIGLAQANPNEGFWTVDEVPTERVYDEAMGVVVERPDFAWKSRPNTIVAKIKGRDGKVKEHAVVFDDGDERAMRMAGALKNLDATQLEGLLGVSASITRYFASVNTQYNPIFGVVNLVRDVQGAILNLSSTPLAGDEGKIARNTISALVGIYGDARAARKGKNPGSAWAKLWDEFQEVGGQTGYRDLFRTSADRAEAIKNTLNPDAWMDSKLGKVFTANGALKVPMAQAKRSAGWIFDWLSDYNLAMENGVRLAAYKAGLERGLSKEQAASEAKNLTVNFNRKGQVSQQAGAMYAFFNASLQGTARIAKTVFQMEPGKPNTIRLSPMGKKIVYGGILLGSIQAMALAAAGYNDEDPPQFARERSLIIPLMNGKYFSIPMPLGFHVVPNIGRIATEFALSGFKDPHERAVQLFSLFADTFNPIGNAGLSMQTLSPTALDPLVALTENRDWTGKPITRESMNPATPGTALARDTATSLSKMLAEAINTVSGGNKYVAGVFSPSPDQIDYLLGQVTGGVGRELSKIEQSTLAVARGEALPTYKIPLVGRFIGDTKQQASEGAAFYANTERLNELETEIKGLQKDGKYAEAAEVRRNNSDAYLITMANQAERQIQKLRGQKRELVKGGAPREQVRAVEEQITAVMSRLNRAVERLREKQEN